MPGKLVGSPREWQHRSMTAAMSAWHRPLLVAIALLGSASSSATAQANGRFPATTNLRFSPTNDQLMLMPTTFGLLISQDGAATFHWICEKTVGYGGTYDPDYAITDAGDIYATTFEGLQISRDGGCTFAKTEFYNDLSGGSAPVLLTGEWVGEVEVASDGKVWATTSTGGSPNDIYVSSDGQRFDSAGKLDQRAWWKTLRVSKSSPDTIYVSGFLIADGATPAKALLFKTSDGGANWSDLGVADFAFGTQPNLFLEGVSATDPNTLYARVLAARDPQGDDLYRSTDGGARWQKVLELHGIMGAFALLADGSVIAGSATPCKADLQAPPADGGLPNKGCVFSSPSGAAGTWAPTAQQPKLGCLGVRPSDNSLFACASNFAPDNFALGTSSDLGATWTKITRFTDIAGPLECPSTTKQFTCAEEAWPAVCSTLAICNVGDAGPGSAGDGGAIGPDAGDSKGETSSGCLGCQQGSGGGLLIFLAALGVYLLAFRRRAS